MILTPKCPLCLAGYLSVVGLGAAAPVVFWVLRPLAVALALLPLLQRGYLRSLSSTRPT